MAPPLRWNLVLLTIAGVILGVGVVAMAIGEYRGRAKTDELVRRLHDVFPKDPDLEVPPTFVGDMSAIRVSLDRLDPDDKDRAQTRIRIGDREWLLPISQYTGVAAQDEALDARRDEVFALVEARIKELHASDAKLTGVIATPPPRDRSVPHADIVKVINAFLGAGVTDVNFAGAASPRRAPRLDPLSPVSGDDPFPLPDPPPMPQDIAPASASVANGTFAVDLTEDGNLEFGGRQWPLATVAVPNSSPIESRPATRLEAQETLVHLREALRAATRDPKTREADGSSKVVVKISGDRTAKWKYVQWVMTVCTDPQIKIYRIAFSVPPAK